MKIVVFGIRGLPSTYSGLEAIMSELAPRWVEKGHEVLVYCRSELFPEKLPEWRGVRLKYIKGIEHKTVSTLSNGFFGALEALKDRPDVAFVWNAANGPYGWILKMAGIPAVINVDGLEWLRPKWRGIAAKYFKWAAWMATRSYPYVVTDAAEMQRVYKDDFGVDTTYIGYGADIKYSTEPERVRSIGVEPGQYYLIASRMIEDNNADIIVKGFVASKSPKKLVVAGGANYKGNEREMAFANRVKSFADDRVLFTGHINDSETIKELHCNAYGYIHGHEFGGINPSLLKALAYGNCILALKTPFNREVLDEGKYGMLFEKNAEAVTRLVNCCEDEPETVKDYASRGRERILQRFTWDQIADEYLDLFKKVMK